MWIQVTRFFCAIGFIFFINLSLSAQNPPVKSEDYKNWSFDQLIFTIDSGLLDKETRLEYIDFYLQKAKRENSIEDIVIGYKKKTALSKGYNKRTAYADSLLILAHKLQDNETLGVAYRYKSAVEIAAKNYQTALDYGLKAIEYLENTDDLYTINEIKNIISISYFHLEKFEEAYKIYMESTNYYFKNKEKSYNNRSRYIIHLFGLGKSAYRLQKLDTLQVIIADGYKGIQGLKTHRQPLETAYFSLLDGMFHHTFGKFYQSDSLLQIALPEIKQNNDFANEHLISLYLGKNAWKTDKKQQALHYFEKVDSLYQNKDFINSELSEAYTYLINYYKEQKDIKKQLHYTNTLLDISQKLQTQNKELTNYMHENLVVKNLNESKAQLEKEIKNNQLWRKRLYVAIGLLIVLVITGLFFAKRRTKSQISTIFKKSKNQAVEDSKIIAPEILSTDEILLKKLDSFEKDKGFLQKITLQELANDLLTNRTTLSQVLNEHKGGFKAYIKKLRIDYAYTQIEQDPKLQQLNFDALAEEFGFGSGRSFSAAFKEITDTNLNDFIQMSKQNLVN